jgi:hypothetical protein
VRQCNKKSHCFAKRSGVWETEWRMIGVTERSQLCFLQWDEELRSNVELRDYRVRFCRPWVTKLQMRKWFDLSCYSHSNLVESRGRVTNHLGWIISVAYISPFVSSTVGCHYPHTQELMPVSSVIDFISETWSQYLAPRPINEPPGRDSWVGIDSNSPADLGFSYRSIRVAVLEI